MDQSLSNSSNPENRLLTATNPMTTNINPDDNVIEKQVLETHLPDGTNADVKTFIYIVEQILLQKPEGKSRNTDAHQNALVTLNSLSHIIDKLACEMRCKWLSDGDGHHTTALSLLQTVGNFQWDAKLAMILACFALNHGEFWLQPQIMEPLKPKFEALTKLIHSVLESTRCIMQLKELPSTYLSADVAAMDAALITLPSAVYWNVRGIIACAAQITSFTSMGHQISSSEMLSTLTQKINRLLEFLKKQLEECNLIIGDRKDLDFRHAFNRLFETFHIDNMEILKMLINSRDDPLPLFDGSTKNRVSLEVLRRRNVLLLISGLDMSAEEQEVLKIICFESRVRRESLYELVWVPIVDPYTDAMDIQFADRMNTMPWYSVYRPSNFDRAVKKSIGDRWNFKSKPILVALDPQGKELSRNAIHMMWIWGSFAFPFTTAREEALWRGETWSLRLILGPIDPSINRLLVEDTYTFLYGGDDIEWIRKFTNNARAMATADRIHLEMMYVGKNNRLQNAKRAMDTVIMEKLGYCWLDNFLVWFFWTRLKSILLSKIRLKQDDDIMLQTKKLLGYEKEGSWALLARGSEILTIGHGSTMLQTTADFDLWKEHIPTRGFDLSFKEYHDKLHVAANNCCKVDFPHEEAGIPEYMGCPECHRVMGKHVSFLCCHD